MELGFGTRPDQSYFVAPAAVATSHDLPAASSFVSPLSTSRSRTRPAGTGKGNPMIRHEGKVHLLRQHELPGSMARKRYTEEEIIG